MTWCPLLCYPLSPSPVNIERFFKLGAKFCRKKISSQALNCFLLLVHTASSFATGQKELMFQRESPNVWGWQSGWSRHWTGRFAFFSYGEVAFCLPLPRLPISHCTLLARCEVTFCLPLPRLPISHCTLLARYSCNWFLQALPVRDPVFMK